MGYSQAQKAATHAKLLKLAGRMLRENGPDKLTVGRLMRRAGLTHGGFYAHFASRDAMLAAAVSGLFAEAAETYRRAGHGRPPRDALANMVDSYVSSAHRDRPSPCPVVTLGSDLPRQTRAFRAAYRAGMERLVEVIAGWIETGGAAERATLAATTLSAMAGAIAVARAVRDGHVADAVLATARRDIKAGLGLDAEPRPGRRP